MVLLYYTGYNVVKTSKKATVTVDLYLITHQCRYGMINGVHLDSSRTVTGSIHRSSVNVSLTASVTQDP